MDKRLPAFQGLDQLSYDLIPADRAALCPILNGPDQASLVVIHGASEARVADGPRSGFFVRVVLVVATALNLCGRLTKDTELCIHGVHLRLQSVLSVLSWFLSFSTLS